ncbi:NDR1/HIN1-like protein 26 [Typha latifolia]|uniref:NDR1/HIN1-like protein 26 n=1 Tax=Typha latifolia TaxID=4733 RepID=UPI003C2EB544
MSSYQSPLPTQTRPNHPPRTRFTHRVHEKLTTRLAKCLCSVLLTLILITGIILFVLWLSLRPHRPRFHLSSFSISGITQPASSAVIFNVTDRNRNKKIGIYYDTMYGSVYYFDRLIGSGPVLFPFYQPPKNTTSLQGTFSLAGPKVGDSNWGQFSANVAAGRVQLRFELNSTIRFKVKVWDTHRHHLHVECNLVVGGDGNMLASYKDEKCSIYF